MLHPAPEEEGETERASSASPRQDDCPTGIRGSLGVGFSVWCVFVWCARLPVSDT